jgi:hypothetical protein
MKLVVIIIVLLSAVLQVHSQNVRLDFPNGSEMLTSGTDTLIRWSGILPADTVRLEYSSDAGRHWELISNSASGNAYQWHTPSQTSESGLVKITQLSKNLQGWAKQAGGGGHDNGRSIAVDSNGNLYTTGFFLGTAHFGNITLKSLGGRDIFVAKYSSEGNILWARQAEGTSDEQGLDIAVDRNGDVFVCGGFQGGVRFGSIKLINDGFGDDIFIAKYTTNGDLQWVKHEGGLDHDVARSIAVDFNDDVYIGGEIKATYFDTVLLNDTNRSFFLVKYRGDGNLQWLKLAGGNSFEGIYDISPDDNGNVYLTGVFSDIIFFDEDTLKAVNDEYDDIFIAKYTSTGNVEWVTRAGGKYTDVGNTIAVDGTGDIIITGEFRETAIFDSIVLASSGSALFPVDMFVAKLNPEGKFQWAVPVGEHAYINSHVSNSGLAVDRENNIFITGSFQLPPDLLQIAYFGSDTLVSTGSSGMFVAKLQPDGTLTWAKGGGGGYAETRGSNVCIDSTGHVYVIGQFSGLTGFDNTALVSNGNTDVFIWKVIEDKLIWDTSDATFFIVEPLGVSDDQGQQFGSHIATKLIPNPAEDILHVQIQLWNSERVKISILNALGQTLVFQSEILTEGLNELAFDIKKLPPGSYSLLLSTPNRRSIARFIKL